MQDEFREGRRRASDSLIDSCCYMLLLLETGEFLRVFFFFFREDDWFYRLEYSFGNFRFREEDDGMEFWLVLRLKRVLRGDLG